MSHFASTSMQIQLAGARSAKAAGLNPMTPPLLTLSEPLRAIMRSFEFSCPFPDSSRRRGKKDRTAGDTGSPKARERRRK